MSVTRHCQVIRFFCCVAFPDDRLIFIVFSLFPFVSGSSLARLTNRWGFLLKGINVNAKGQKRTFYQPIHSAWSEYAAALYLASVSHYANIIQREVYGLPLDAEPCLTTSAGIHRSSLQVSLTNVSQSHDIVTARTRKIRDGLVSFTLYLISVDFI